MHGLESAAEHYPIPRSAYSENALQYSSCFLRSAIIGSIASKLTLNMHIMRTQRKTG